MQVVRYKQGKTTFEVGCKVGAVLRYRKEQISFDQVLQSEEIWKDIKKGDRSNAEELKAAFGIDNPKEIAKLIVDKGEVQLTDGERKDILEKKRNEIINYIHKYYIDPKTKTMIPVARIDNALTEIKVRIDPDQSTEKQVQEILKKLPGVLTLKRAEITGAISSTHQHLSQVTGVLKKYNVAIQSESYSSQGCTYFVSMVPGDYDKIFADLNSVTKGDYDFVVDGQPTTSVTTTSTSEKEKEKEKEKSTPPAKGGRGRGGRAATADTDAPSGRGGRGGRRK
eukprot:TRINITY_DN237_c1_g1_i1.p1 TRINITY_DN237_c1_g1~~TRINITY_DN237_c1_g1_i1.p1  ORF type:complete len:281 (+),score=74.09 TRINITY_DN237_c1_g1_i1:363-1205(+)